MRAKVYVDRGYPGFVRALRDALAAEGAAYAVIGDAVCPLPAHLAAGMADVAVVHHHRIVHDVTCGDDALLGRMTATVRANLRKAARAGVTVSTITTDEDLRAFTALNAETAGRIRGRHLVAALPDRFFDAVLRSMVPTGQAVLLLARAGSVPLAGALLFRNGEYLTYYHGVSTRDRTVARLQGPSLLFWEAMRRTRAMGLRHFDHGAVTLTEDRAHPHFSVYDFKRGFGGHVERCPSAQVVLSPRRHAFQERLMLPVWKRLYPLYLRFARAGDVTAAAVAGAMLA